MLSALVFASCSNEDFLAIPDSPPEAVVSNLFKFKYQGVEYTAEYIMEGSEKVFKDTQMGEMLQALENNPVGASITYPDGMVEYFDSTEEFEEYVKSISMEEPATTKAGTSMVITGLSSFTVSIYVDGNYGGGSYSWSGPKQIAKLSSLDSPLVVKDPAFFNNTITSFKFEGQVKTFEVNTGNPWLPGGGITGPPTTVYSSAILNFYDEENYKGKVKSYVITKDSPTINVSNMGDFNDKASSLTVGWVGV